MINRSHVPSEFQDKYRLDSFSNQMSLFPDEFVDIYCAEKAFIKAIPEMIRNCSSEETAIALTGYFNLAVSHVSQFEKVLSFRNASTLGRKIQPHYVLLTEAKELMSRAESTIPGLFI